MKKIAVVILLIILMLLIWHTSEIKRLTQLEQKIDRVITILEEWKLNE
jgi:hypothetical protein